MIWRHNLGQFEPHPHVHPDFVRHSDFPGSVTTAAAAERNQAASGKVGFRERTGHTAKVKNWRAAEAASTLQRELTEGDEDEAGEFAKDWKRFAFDIARGAEAGPNASEICVVIARVRDEFPGAGRNPTEKPVKTHGIECTGGGDAERAAGSRETFFGKDAMPGGLEAAEKADLRSADQAGAGGGANGPGRLKWISD